MLRLAMKLAELKTQALRYLVLGNAGRALGIYEHLVRVLPSDLEPRMKIADLLVAAGMHDLARRVYAAMVFYDLSLGRPLHAIVCMHALAGLGEPLEPLFLPLANRYAADSPSLASGGRGLGARLAPPDPDADVGAPILQEVGDAAALRSYAERVAEIAASTTDLGVMPERYPPVPLLSELPHEPFLKLLAQAVVRRVPVGAALVKEGEPGSSFFFVASGQVRLYARGAATQALDESGQHEMGRLSEGGIFGELALVSAQPRGATVEALTEVDAIELSCNALRALAIELPAVRDVLERFTRDRLLKNLLATSPLFRPFSPQQRIDLARRFTGHELASGTVVIREGEAGRGLFVVLAGELEVLKGDEPFQSSVAILRGGDLFGEISLIRGTPATATVRAATPAAVLFLARDYFERLISALPEMRAFFEGLSEERLRALKSASSDELLEVAEIDAEPGTPLI
jgi:CRP-like cAMP-binding protein